MDEQPDQFIEFLTTPTRTEAEFVRAMLLEEGIETWLQTPGFGLGLWGAADFNPTTVMVSESESAIAREALLGLRRESLAIDWDNKDLGRSEDETVSLVNGLPEAEIRAHRLSRSRHPTLFESLVVGWLLMGPFDLLLALLIAGAIEIDQRVRAKPTIVVG